MFRTVFHFPLSQDRPSSKTWGSMYGVGRIEVTGDETGDTATVEIINTTILEYNLAEGTMIWAE